MTIAYFCIVAFVFVIYATRWPVILGQRSRPEGYDNHHPRDQQARLDGPARRANAAQMNGFEAFGPFAAGVIVAHLTGGPQRLVDGLAIAFVVLRVVYLFLYIGDKPTARSSVWMLAITCVALLYFSSYFG